MTTTTLRLVAALALAAFTACGGGSAAVDAGAEDAAQDDAPPPVVGITFTSEQTLTIRTFDSTDVHLAFPDVARLGDGRILLVYRGGATHSDPSGRIVKQFGTADGLTWTDPEALHDEPAMDDRDPSVARLASGDLLVSYFQYQGQATADGTVYLHHIFVGRSSDDGATFGTFAQVDPGPMADPNAALDASGRWVDGDGTPIVIMATSSAVIEVGGRLALPAYGGPALDLADLAHATRSHLSIYWSDDAVTWTESVVAPGVATDTWLMEPAILRLDDGTTLMHVRTAAGTSPSSPGNLWQTTSTDDGATWSDYRDLGFVGHAPELLQLRCGVVLSAFRWLDQAFTSEKVSFIHSLDRGATWSDPQQIIDCGAVECGYPGLLELDGNRVLMVYYTPGGRAIEATIYDFEVSY
jgi:hypothetical protein